MIAAGVIDVKKTIKTRPIMADLRSQIESLLFISAKPMSVKQLSSLLKKKPEAITTAGDSLVTESKEARRGIQIIKNGGKYQMASSPEKASLVQEFIKDETTGELSRVTPHVPNVALIEKDV